jgi:hypothetical protein
MKNARVQETERGFPMRTAFLSAVLIAVVFTPARAEIYSAYTTVDPQTDCSTFDAPGPEEEGGDWGNSLCNGWGGYPVTWNYGDARESVYFGYTKPNTQNLPFQSFSGFNSAGQKIEWRINKETTKQRPIATILRWKVSIDPADSSKTNEVLVVSKVGLLEAPQGCVVGYVLATGDPQANEKARGLADQKAAVFTCGKDTPTRIGAVPEPMGDVFTLQP